MNPRFPRFAPAVLRGIAGCLAFLLLTGPGCSWRMPGPGPRDLGAVLDEVRGAGSPAERNPLLTGALHERIAGFRILVESNLVLRAAILREADRLEAEFARQPTLSPADLRMVSEGASKYLRLRDQFLGYVGRYQGLVDLPDEDLAVYGIDPRTRLLAVMVALGAALTLYDNYVLTVARFEQSAALRRYVNDGDRATGMNRRAMEEISDSARSLVNRGQVRAALRQVAAWKARYPEWRRRHGPPGDEPDRLDRDFEYLDALIESSVSYRYVAEIQAGTMTAAKMDHVIGQRVPDLARQGEEAFLRILSQVFVQSIAVIEPRKGRLHTPESRRRAVAAELADLLRPGDILVEKSGFRLNDMVVPGHFGHSAIWLGTDAELEALGVWDDPRLAWRGMVEVDRARAAVRDGRGVIEALRPGVRFNTIEHFLNVDDLAVLRPRMNEDPGRRGETRDALVSAITHTGKKYDYGFDIHSRRRVICSELSFHAYTQPEFRWPKSHILGRYTIGPDQVARRALPDNGHSAPLRLVVLYRNGVRVDDGAEALLGRLLDVGGPDLPSGAGR